MSCGPIEVAYAKLTSNVAIAATGLDLTEILRITVPSLPRPVQLWFETLVGYTTAGHTGAIVVGLAPSTTPNQFGAIDAVHEYGVVDTATQVGRKMAARIRLPANSPGDYLLGAARISGSASASILATALVPTQLGADRV